MAGLLVKDFGLMRLQKSSILIIIVMSIVMAFSANNDFFLIGFIIFIIPQLAVTTVSYDEHENGNAFLFTLPVSRSLYVREKYFLGALLCIASLVFADALCLVINLFRGVALRELLIASLPMAMLRLIVFAIMLPVQLKFGAERSRMVLIIIWAATIVLPFSAAKLFGLEDLEVSDLSSMLPSLQIGTMLLAMAVFTAICVLLSMRISMSIMKKKEF